MAAATTAAMSEWLAAAGLAGAALCLAGHLPGPVHRWGPQLLALSGMVLMAGGRAVPGTWMVAAACLWNAVRAVVDRHSRSAAVDLAAMTLLMLVMTGHSGFGAHAHMAGMAHMAGTPAAGPAVLIVIVWFTARAGEIMLRQLADVPAAADGAAPAARRGRVCRESGATLMITSMAAMLV